MTYVPVANEEQESPEELRAQFDPEAFKASLDKHLKGISWASGIGQLSLNETLEVLRRNLSPNSKDVVGVIPGLDPKESYQASITEIEGQERLANAPEIEEPVFTQKFVFTFRGEIYSRPFSHYKRDHNQLRRDMAAQLGSTWRNAYRTIKVVQC